MSLEQEPAPAFDQPVWGDIYPGRDSGWDLDQEAEDLIAAQQIDEEGATPWQQ